MSVGLKLDIWQHSWGETVSVLTCGVEEVRQNDSEISTKSPGIRR